VTLVVCHRSRLFAVTCHSVCRESAVYPVGRWSVHNSIPRFSTNAYGEDGSVDTIDCHTNTLEMFPRGVFRHEDRVCTLGTPDVRISTLDLDSIQANPCIDVPV
jgi:hypothetical protein